MQLNEIHAFVTVVEAGSFTEAGRRLGMPKSTLSKQVARLEARLGSRLLQRTTRKLHLTETGRAYFDRCSAAIEDLRNAERVAQDVSGTPKGRLRVTAPFDFGRQYLAPLMVDFHRRYPDVEIELIMSQRRIDMIDEGIDVALRGGAQPDSSLVSRQIFGSEVLLCASPEYLDRRGRPKSAADLAEHETVSMPSPPGGWRLEGPGGPVVLPMRPWLVANEWGYLRRAQLDGLGIGPNIIQTVADDLRSGDLERVLPELGLSAGGGLFAVYPSRHHLSPKVRVFVDFLVESLGHLDPRSRDR